MATSGSVDFTRTRNQIIFRALRLCNVIEQGETPESSTVTNCAEALNMMVKAWRAEGYPLWLTREAVLHFTVGQANYDLGSTSTDFATLESDAKKTEIATAAASGASTVTVDSDDDIAASDLIGVELDDGTLDWDTVSGAPSSDVVTLTSTLGGAAAVDNHVYSYTTDLIRPLRITNARCRLEDGTEIPATMVSRQEYWDTPNKSAQGKPTMVWYDPKRDALGEIWLWPTPETVQDRLVFTAHMPIEDFDAASDNPDLPVECFNAVCWGLAYEMCEEYSVPDNLSQRIGIKAATYREAMKQWDQEPESLFIVPDMGP